jgi:ribonuclease Z
MARTIEVVLLGTGSPLPSPVRCGAGQVVIAGETRVMIDCGWGVARRLFGVQIVPQSIDVLCFTHMHSDHITDFPDFIISRWTGGATRPLQIYGPEGTRETVAGFLAALRRDIGYRLAHHGEKLSRAGIEVEVHELPATLSPVRALTHGGLEIESFEVDHRPVVPAFGYRVTLDGTRVVFSGDTTVCDSLRQASVDVDLLVCEALNVPMLERRVGALRDAGHTGVAALLADVPGYHAPTIAVAQLARDAGVRRLVLSHVIPPIPNEGPQVAEFIAGMDAIYKGPIAVAQDMQRITVGPRG